MTYIHIVEICGFVNMLVSDDSLNVSERIYGPGVGKATDSETPDEELLKIVTPLSKYEVDRICINLGGKNVTQIKNTVQKLFTHSEIGVYRESSGTLPLYVLKKRNSDIVLLAGTGTIAIGKNGDRKYIGGGWGCDIGDEGSGYWIGNIPVIAEGRYWTHQHIQSALDLGAYGIVIGKAITNPIAITKYIISGLKF